MNLFELKRRAERDKYHAMKRIQESPHWEIEPCDSFEEFKRKWYRAENKGYE